VDTVAVPDVVGHDFCSEEKKERRLMKAEEGQHDTVENALQLSSPQWQAAPPFGKETGAYAGKEICY